MQDDSQSQIHRTVLAFAAAGIVAASACALMLPQFPLRFGVAISLAAAGAVALGAALLDRFAVRLPFGAERIALSLQEPLLVGLLVLVSPAIAPIVAAAGAAFGQAMCRRNVWKSTFNVAQETLSVAAASAVAMAATMLGVAAVVALALAPLVYAALSHVSVAAVVARVERVRVREVLQGPMLRVALATALVGESTGLAVGLLI